MCVCVCVCVQAGFRKGKGTRDQTANICWIIHGESKGSSEKHLLLLIDFAKVFDCVDHKKTVENSSRSGTCLLRSLYAGQEATVRTGHGTTNWFQIGIGEQQGCILSPCLFNFYAEYLMRNAGLDESQAGIRRLLKH